MIFLVYSFFKDINPSLLSSPEKLTLTLDLSGKQIKSNNVRPNILKK